MTCAICGASFKGRGPKKTCGDGCSRELRSRRFQAWISKNPVRYRAACERWMRRNIDRVRESRRMAMRRMLADPARRSLINARRRECVRKRSVTRIRICQMCASRLSPTGVNIGNRRFCSAACLHEHQRLNRTFDYRINPDKYRDWWAASGARKRFGLSDPELIEMWVILKKFQRTIRTDTAA